MKKELNVLSLFDGISCGQLALNRAKVKTNKYYSSEVDKYAIQKTQENYPKTIQIGDVSKWREWDVDWSDIDLLIGGSPCQGFSRIGKQLNFEDPRSKLFFQYVEVLNHIKKINTEVKFLLENVRMKKEYQNVISKFLGVESIALNSALVSAQNRPRLYWTNIPDVGQPKDRGVLFKDIQEDLPFRELKPFMFGYYGKARRIDKCKTIDALKANCCTTSRFHTNQYYLNSDRTKMRNLSINEYEALQTLPKDFTKGIPITERFKCVGNSWTAEMIAHILKNMNIEN